MIRFLETCIWTATEGVHRQPHDRQFHYWFEKEGHAYGRKAQRVAVIMLDAVPTKNYLNLAAVRVKRADHLIPSGN